MCMLFCLTAYKNSLNCVVKVAFTFEFKDCSSKIKTKFHLNYLACLTHDHHKIHKNEVLYKNTCHGIERIRQQCCEATFNK